MTDKPKTLYHGSQSEITDGFIRMRPGHINERRDNVSETVFEFDINRFA